MIKRKLLNNSGMALAVVIMVFAVVTIIASVGLTVAVSDTRLSVASENYTKAYYIARSAADVVSNDIDNKLKHLEQLETDMGNASIENAEAAIAAYYAEKDRLADLNLIPDSPGDIHSVEVDGIGASDVEVKIENVMNAIEVTGIYTYEGRQAKAKVRIGEVTQSQRDLLIPSFSGKNSVYTWGDLNRDKKDLTYTGYISSGSPEPADAGDRVAGAVYGENRGVGIIVPPEEFSGVDLRTSTLKASMAAGNSVEISKNDNGYYGDLNDAKLDWSVDTSLGDVVLIFNSIVTADNASSIKVYGSNHLYIYLVEKNSENMFEIKNGLTIKSYDYELNKKGEYVSVLKDDIVRTSIIAYTDEMQTWYNDPSNISPTNKSIPADEVDLSNTNGFGAWNNLDASAFFYLPFCDVSVKNNGDFTGALYVGSLSFDNNTNVTFKDFNPSNVIPPNNLAIAGVPTEIVVTTFDWDLNKVWIK